VEESQPVLIRLGHKHLSRMGMSLLSRPSYFSSLKLAVASAEPSVSGVHSSWSANCLLICDLAGAIWSNTMPHQLDLHLPFLNATERAQIYGSITIAARESLDSPIRQGVITGMGSVL
jgi:hypothetical protein